MSSLPDAYHDDVLGRDVIAITSVGRIRLISNSILKGTNHISFIDPRTMTQHRPYLKIMTWVGRLLRQPPCP